MDDILNQIITHPAIAMVGMAIAVAMVALWIGGAWWAYSDAAHRTENLLAAMLAAGWIIASTPLLLPLSLPIYAFARPQQSAGERRTKRLAAELVEALDATAADLACPACRTPVEPDWLRCPACTSWLAVPCAGCGTWSDGSLGICPFCGSEARAEPVADAVEPAPPARLSRRGRRQVRPSGPGRVAAAVGPRPGQRRSAAPEARPVAPLRVR